MDINKDCHWDSQGNIVEHLNFTDFNKINIADKAQRGNDAL